MRPCDAELKFKDRSMTDRSHLINMDAESGGGGGALPLSINQRGTPEIRNRYVSKFSS